MVKIAFIFFKRNIRLYFRVSFFSFFFLLLVSFFALGYASFERISVTKTVCDTKVDYSTYGTVSNIFTLDNVSKLFSYGSEWKALNKSWNDNINTESLFLILKIHFNNSLFFLGIDLLNNTNNIRRTDLYTFNIGFFNIKLDVSSFTAEETLPFNLDVLINLDKLNLSLPPNIQITPYNAQIGYFVDLNTNHIFSFKHYMKVLKNIEDFFNLFVAQRDLVYLNSIENNIPDLEIVNPFIEPFKALVILFSFISLLLSSWLIEFFLNIYYRQIANVLEKFEKRGFSKEDCNKIVKTLPIIIDTFVFIVLGSLYLFIYLIAHINTTISLIAAGVGYIFLVYKRIKFTTFDKDISDKLDSLSFSIYVLFLLIFSIAPIIVLRTLYPILPSWISSLISIGSTIIQYYVVALLLSELFMRIYKKYKSSHQSSSIDNLISKSLTSGKKHLTSWFQSSIIFIWSITIVFSSIQTFNVNYEIHHRMLYPTDVTININLPLANISQLEILPEIEYIIPMSHSVEKYFLNYDLYLINFTALQHFFPDFCKLSNLDQLNAGYTYMYKSMARELDFRKNDLFPTKFGENGSNIIVNQPIIITEYFPLVEPISNRPFIVSNYRYEFENFTIVNKLLVNFKDNIDINKGLDALGSALNTNLQVETPLIQLSYNIPFFTYQYFFLLITLFIGGLNFIQVINHLSTIFNRMYLRGLNKKRIKILFIKEISPLIFSSTILGFLSGLFFLFIQARLSIYHISLFVPFKIYLSFNLFLLLLIPLLYVSIIFLAQFEKE
ncbi:MAG: hypothetical protein ACTSQE_10945 [Candidatus Heimdallarchaeaceae archaeon]